MVVWPSQAQYSFAVYTLHDHMVSLLYSSPGTVIWRVHACGTLFFVTGGLVGIASFSVLPDITPPMTLVLVILGMTPCLIQTWRHPTPSRFPLAAVHACLTSFLLGFHVHEKAILMATVPLGWLAANSHSITHVPEGGPDPSQQARKQLQTGAAEASRHSISPTSSRKVLQNGASAHGGSGTEATQQATRALGDDGSQASNRATLGSDKGLQQEASDQDEGGGGHEASLLVQYQILGTAGHYGLLPLIYTLQEYPIKVALCLVRL